MTMPTERVSTRSSVNNMADHLATDNTNTISSKSTEQMDQSAHDHTSRIEDGPSSTTHIAVPTVELSNSENTRNPTLKDGQAPPKYTVHDDRMYIDQALEKINKTLK